MSSPSTASPTAAAAEAAANSPAEGAKDSSANTNTGTSSTTKQPNAIEFEPPLACVRRILKNSLPSSTNVGKDASAAFARACGIFIIYLTACANDFARENKRQTITANDVLAALTELDFQEFTPQLTTFLEAYRATERTKKETKAAVAKNKGTTAGKSKAATAAGDDDDDDEEEEHDDGTPAAHTTSPTIAAAAAAAAVANHEDVEEEHEDDDDEEAEDVLVNNAAATPVKPAVSAATAADSVGTGKRPRQDDDDDDKAGDANLDKAVAGVAAADGSKGDAATQSPAAKKQKVLLAADGGSEAASVPLNAQTDKEVA